MVCPDLDIELEDAAEEHHSASCSTSSACKPKRRLHFCKAWRCPCMWKTLLQSHFHLLAIISMGKKKTHKLLDAFPETAVLIVIRTCRGWGTSFSTLVSLVSLGSLVSLVSLELWRNSSALACNCSSSDEQRACIFRQLHMDLAIARQPAVHDSLAFSQGAHPIGNKCSKRSGAASKSIGQTFKVGSTER
jgi:hypothetical protein